MATIEQRIYNGNRAKEILENEVFQSVFDDIEREIFEAWKSAPQRDEDGQRRLHQYQTMLTKVKMHLTSTFETGKLAELDLRHKQSLFDKAKEWISPDS